MLYCGPHLLLPFQSDVKKTSTSEQSNAKAADTATRRRTVRTYLAWLVLACLLPCAIGALALFSYQYQKGREGLIEDTTQTARALVQAVDYHLLLAETLTESLSSDEALQRGDFAGFHARAREAVALSGLGTNIVLRDQSGRQLVNTAIDYGMPLPAVRAPDQVHEVFATGKPSVSNVFIGPLLKRPLMSVDVPVKRDGRTVYAIGIGILPDHFNAILKKQQLPSDWTVAIFDKSGSIVGRSHSPDAFVGQKLIPDLMQVIGQNREDVVEASTKEGTPSVLVYSRSNSTNWGVAVGIARTSIVGTLMRTLATVALGIAIVFGLTWLLARHLSSKIAAPIMSLTAPAAALGAGSAVSVPDLPLKEAHEVGVALRQAHAAIMRSNEEVRVAAERVQLALAAGAIVGTWDWELPTDCFAVDERFAEYFGIDPALGRTGLSLQQVIASVHPDDVPGLRNAINEAIRRGGPYSHEYRVRGRDGVYRWIEANGRVDHAPDGTPTRFPGVLLDLEQRRAVETERDRARQQLRAFVDAVPGVVYAKDRDGRMLVANRGVTTVVGKPAEDFLGKTDAEFLDNKEQAAAVMATDRRIMECGQPEIVEEEVNFPDGSHAVWLSTKAPFYDNSGQVIGLIGSSIDITSRKAAEQALIEADRHRNEFLAMLGHELRNPLAPISNAVNLLELAGDKPELRSKAVQVIQRQATHMARLVDDLLEVSRVTRGQIELHKERIRVATPVFSAVETVRSLVEERNQTLHIDVAQNIDVIADPARLTQILTNLLNNASKYTQPGGRIEVRTQIVGANDEHVEVVVADNGPGIQADLLPRIFDLFTQAPTTLDRSRGGLGLGLALVKRLVDLHGGKVWAESAGLGMGATFIVCLPDAEGGPATPDARAQADQQVVAPTSFLVVDDNLDALDTLAMLLEAGGHRVERAYDGEEALEVAARFSPQVVLLDIGLPKLDGWEVARRLRAHPATVGAVLIALTGYGQEDDRQRSLESGFDYHFLKPADLDAIYSAVAARRNRFRVATL